MTKPFGFVPLSRTLPYWPVEQFGPPGGILDYIGVTDFEIESEPGSLSMSGKLAYLQELAFPLPALDGVTVAVLSNGTFTEIEFAADLAPDFNLELKKLGVDLRIESDLLRPMKQEGGEWKPLLNTDGSAQALTVGLGKITVSVNGEGEVDVAPGVGGLTIAPVQIGGTGLILEITGLDLSRDQTTNKVDGVLLKTAKIHIPGDTSAPDVTLTDARIISSGFSGEVSADFGPSGITTKLFGCELTLMSLDFKFSQNVPVSSSIKGKILLPFFDEKLTVEVGITSDDGLTIGIKDGIGTLTKPNLLRVDLDAIEIEITDGKPLFTLSGSLTPLIPGMDWPTFAVEALTIDHKGHIDLDGGWLDLSKQEPFDFKGFTIQITKFGLGHTDDGGQWVGVSGLVNLIKGVQGSASVEGLRITWYQDGTKKVTLNGIGVEMTIAEVLYLKGAVSFKSNPGFYRFDGALTLALETPQLVFDSRMTIGRMLEDPDNASSRKIPFGAIYADMEMPNGFPIGTTGAGLFALSGFFALNMVPGRDPEQKWFGKDESPIGWYHDPDVGIFDTTKWVPRKGRKAFGFGLGVGTFNDGAFTFYAKGLAILSFPGPFMIEARGNILKQRKAMSSSDDPLFRAVAIFDRESGEYTFGLDAFYKYGQNDGEVIDIRASIEAYYNKFDPTLWHVYFGQKPRDRRVQAEVISLFTAQSYFMLDASSLQMGVWVGFEEDWTLGPLSVELSAFIDSAAKLSFAPVHFQASIWLHGGIELSAFGVGLGITCDARLEGEVNDPFHVLGTLTVALALPFPLKDIEETISLEWGPEDTPPPIPIVLKDVTIEHLKSTAVWPLEWGRALGPSFDDGQGFLTGAAPFQAAPASIPVVPMDARISLTFAHSVHDDAQVGVNGLVPNPAWERVGDPQSGTAAAQVRYAIKSIILQKRAKGTWVNVAGAGSEATGLPKLFGSWAPVNASSGVPGAVEQSKLLLWSKSGFDHTRKTGSEWNDWFKDNFEDYPCAPARDWDCYDFEGYPIGPVDDLHSTSDYVILNHANESELQFIAKYGLKVRDISAMAGSSNLHALQPYVPWLPDEHSVPQYLLIVLPEDTPVKSVRVKVFSTGPIRKVSAMYGSFNEEWAYFASCEVEAGFDELRLQSANGISYVYLHDDHHNRGGFFGVVEVCLSDAEDAAEVLTVSEHLSSATSHWADQGEVLEPNTDYQLEIHTEADVLGPISGPRTQISTASFRTGAPPAIKPTPVLQGVPATVDPNDTTSSPPATKYFGWDLSGQNELGGGRKISKDASDGIEDLSLYVRQTVPPTVGAGSNAPLMPRPVFRAYDTGVMFNENYVDLLYRMAGRDLRIQITDGNALPVRTADGQVLSFENAWGVTTEHGISELDQTWLDYVDPDCHPIPIGSIPLNQKLDTKATPLLLKPNARYRVRLAPLMLSEMFSAARFDDGAMITSSTPIASWSVVGSSSEWVIANSDPATSHITQTGISSEARLIYDPSGSKAWTGYRLSVAMKFGGALHIGAYINHQSANQFVRFNMDRTTNARTLAFGWLNATNVAQISVLASDIAATPLSDQQEYAVQMEMVGERIVVSMDGELVFDVDVSAEPHISRTGAFGLWSNNGAGATFRNVQVECFGAAAATAYAFEFATSSFVNFAHLTHSRRTPVWTYEVAEDDAAISTATSKAAMDQALPPSNSEAAQYEALKAQWLDAGMVGIPGSRNPLDPSAFEINRVERDGETVAWIIRSGEPLDWARTTFELRRTGQKTPSSHVLGPAKVIGARLNATTPDEELIDILFHDRVQIEGWQLQKRVFDLPGAAKKLPTVPLDDSSGMWETLHEFAAAETYGGLSLRLGSGNTLPVPPNHTWSTLARAVSGTSGAIDLSSLGADLRLVDAKGQLISATRILPRASFAAAPEPVRFLRKLDATAVILLPKTGFEFKSGSYALDMRYKRDLSAAGPDGLVLSQAGVSGDEFAWVPLY